MYPFIKLISTVLNILNFLIICHVVLSLLIAFKIVNQHQPIVERIEYALRRLCEPMLRPFRRLLPDLGGIDLSPIILLLIINFLDSALWYYFVK